MWLVVISFDKFHRYEQPHLILCNPGSLYDSSDGITNAVGEITDVSDIEIVFNFDTKSEMKFRIYDTLKARTSEAMYSKEMYEFVKTHRYIFIDEVGYFIITDTNDEYSDGIKHKDVTACSVEQELDNRNVPYIENGTYPLFSNDYENPGILNLLYPTFGYWTIDHIDSSLLSEYRTFNDVDVDQSVYAFMMDKVQDAFDCVIIFDILNRKINVYDKTAFISHTDICITRDDWIEAVTAKHSSDNTYTALRATSNAEIGISAVNPIGTNVVYDFSNYLTWMPSALAQKVQTWQALVTSYEASYYSASSDYYLEYDLWMAAVHEIERLNIVLDLYQQCKTNIQTTQTTNNVGAFNQLIENNGGTPIDIKSTIQATILEIDGLIAQTEQDIDDEEAVRDARHASMNNYKDTMDDITDEVAITEYFTQDEYNELSCYIFEGTYTDEYVVVTSEMDGADKVEQMETLYQRTKNMLNYVSDGLDEYSMDIGSFPLIEKYKSWTAQLKTGCGIMAEAEDDELKELILTTITVNYEDANIEFTFNNKLSRGDQGWLFRKLAENIKKSANSITYM